MKSVITVLRPMPRARERVRIMPPKIMRKLMLIMVLPRPIVLEDDTEGDDDEQYPHALRDDVAVAYVRVLARHVDHPAQKGAEYDAHDDDDRGDDDIGQGARDARRVLGELGHADQIEAEGENK